MGELFLYLFVDVTGGGWSVVLLGAGLAFDPQSFVSRIDLLLA